MDPKQRNLEPNSTWFLTVLEVESWLLDFKSFQGRRFEVQLTLQMKTDFWFYSKDSSFVLQGE